MSRTTNERQQMSTRRISYVPLEQMDERMQEEMQRCAREGESEHQ